MVQSLTAFSNSLWLDFWGTQLSFSNVNKTMHSNKYWSALYMLFPLCSVWHAACDTRRRMGLEEIPARLSDPDVLLAAPERPSRHHRNTHSVTESRAEHRSPKNTERHPSQQSCDLFSHPLAVQSCTATVATTLQPLNWNLNQGEYVWVYFGILTYTIL